MLTNRPDKLGALASFLTLTPDVSGDGKGNWRWTGKGGRQRNFKYRMTEQGRGIGFPAKSSDSPAFDQLRGLFSNGYQSV